MIAVERIAAGRASAVYCKKNDSQRCAGLAPDSPEQLAQMDLAYKRAGRVCQP